LPLPLRMKSVFSMIQITGNSRSGVESIVTRELIRDMNVTSKTR
jgi:hypothetical protein